LQKAAQALVERHASLRAGFEHAQLSQPVQIIAAGVRPRWCRLDLSLLDEERRAQRLGEVLAQDRCERFDLASPPLLRFTLIRLGREQHRLVLTSPHILLGGWSAPVPGQGLLTVFAHKGHTAAVPRVTLYRDYLAWVAAQDRAAAISAWVEALSDLPEGSLLAPRGQAGAPHVPQQIILALGEPLTAALNEQARRHGVTVNTLI